MLSMLVTLATQYSTSVEKTKFFMASVRVLYSTSVEKIQATPTATLCVPATEEYQGAPE